VAIDLGSVDGGYAWSFPKKNSSWGLGVAGFLTPLTDPKSEFRKYLSSRNAELDPAGAVTWPLPNYRSARHGRIPGLFLVGDAGGIVDPFLGEGIYYAVLSGTRAAESILSSRVRSADSSQVQALGSKDYSCWLDTSVWPDFRQGSRLAQAIYRFPGVFFRLTGRYPGLLDLYASILTGEHDYRSFSREIVGRALRMFLPGHRPADGRAL
jgi:flavin-dependent dehydrogenase